MQGRILPFLQERVDFPPGVVGVLTEVGKAFMGVIYVLEGSLKLDSADLQDVLEAGDCVCLDSEMLITWGATWQIALSGLGCHFRRSKGRGCNSVNQA